MDGSAVLEPWVERIADWGTCGVVTKDDIELVGTHRVINDGTGGFAGIDVRDDAPAAVRDIAIEAGRRIARLGYRGPFGIDAFEWRHGAATQLALSEINARLTFGFVAHALSKSFDGALTVGASGDGEVLVSPTADAPHGAWITRS